MILEKIKSKWVAWRSLEVSEHFYHLGFVFALLGLIFVEKGVSGINRWHLIAFILFAFGFLLRARKFLIGSWSTPWRKFSTVAIHALILVVTLMCARLITVDALGLPPKDFDSTVHLLSLELYPFAWMLMISLGLAFLVLPIMLVCGLVMISKAPLFDDCLLFLVRALPHDSRFRVFVDRGRDRFTIGMFGHCMGSMIVAAVMSFGWDANYKFLKDHLGYIRAIAYRVDYMNLYNYPGFDEAERMLLHGDGVVSYAKPDANDRNNATIRVVANH